MVRGAQCRPEDALQECEREARLVGVSVSVWMYLHRHDCLVDDEKEEGHESSEAPTPLG